MPRTLSHPFAGAYMHSRLQLNATEIEGSPKNWKYFVSD